MAIYASLNKRTTCERENIWTLTKLRKPVDKSPAEFFVKPGFLPDGRLDGFVELGEFDRRPQFNIVENGGKPRVDYRVPGLFYLLAQVNQAFLGERTGQQSETNIVEIIENVVAPLDTA